MKWVLFMVGSAGLLSGAGCSSWQNPQPYAYYPQGYAPPTVAAPTYAPPYYAQPAAPVVATGAPMIANGAPVAQPVVYQAAQPACVPCACQ